MPGKLIDLAAITRLDMSGKERRMAHIANAVQREWRRLASQRLNTTVVPYREAIVIESVTSSSATIALAGDSVVPHIVESGMGPGGIGTYGPYDVRTSVLKSGTSNLHTSATGALYVRVPFRHSGASIKSHGGAAAVKQARGLTPSSTEVANRDHMVQVRRGRGTQDRHVKAGERYTKWGGRGGPDPMGRTRQQPKFISHQGKTFAQEPHATGRLTGLVRFGKVYTKKKGGGGGGGKYGTWRTMSSDGKPWMSRGVRPRRIAQAVLANAPNVIREVTAALGGA